MVADHKGQESGPFNLVGWGGGGGGGTHNDIHAGSITWLQITKGKSQDCLTWWGGVGWGGGGGYPQ